MDADSFVWYLNNLDVGGFLAGIVVGIAFLPYIVFGKFDQIRKRILQVFCVILLIALIIGLLYKFYTDGELVCDFCDYIDW